MVGKELIEPILFSLILLFWNVFMFSEPTSSHRCWSTRYSDVLFLFKVISLFFLNIKLKKYSTSYQSAIPLLSHKLWSFSMSFLVPISKLREYLELLCRLFLSWEILDLWVLGSQNRKTNGDSMLSACLSLMVIVTGTELLLCFFTEKLTNKTHSAPFYLTKVKSWHFAW